jgi:hypothetical protein
MTRAVIQVFALVLLTSAAVAHHGRGSYDAISIELPVSAAMPHLLTAGCGTFLPFQPR